jgi:hypothetical protein
LIRSNIHTVLSLLRAALVAVRARPSATATTAVAAYADVPLEATRADIDAALRCIEPLASRPPSKSKTAGTRSRTSSSLREAGRAVAPTFDPSSAFVNFSRLGE